MTYDDILPMLSRLTGQELQFRALPLDAVEARAGSDIAAMIDYFNRAGFVVDSTSVAEKYGVELTRLCDYLATIDWADPVPT